MRVQGFRRPHLLGVSAESLGAIQFFVTEVYTKTSGSNSIFIRHISAAVTGRLPPGAASAVDTTGNIYFSGTTNFFNSGEATNGTGWADARRFSYPECLPAMPGYASSDGDSPFQ